MNRGKPNIFIEQENFMQGIVLGNGSQFIFDKNDLNRVSQHHWYENCQGYIYTIIEGRKIFLHRFILDIGFYENNKLVVDHENHNVKDNRKTNLRVATRTQNRMNNVLRKSSKTGIIGVGWHKKLEKYYAKITIEGRETHLGYFEDVVDAVKTRLKAEKEYYGIFSPQKHLFENYGI